MDLGGTRKNHVMSCYARMMRVDHSLRVDSCENASPKVMCITRHMQVETLFLFSMI